MQGTTVLGKRLEDLDYRIAQYKREGQREERLERRRKALVAAHASAHHVMEAFNDILRGEESKLDHGVRIFHHGMERRMVEDIVAVDNLAVFKAACQYSALRDRMQDIEDEVKHINSVLEHHKDHHEQLEMLAEWREDVYLRADHGSRESNALLHQRLDAWLQVADREDDLDDLDLASTFLEDALMALEASIAAATRVRHVTRKDLAVLASLNPPRSKQFMLLEAVRKAKEAFRHANVLIDTLQGIEHLKVHIRDPVRLLDGMAEALLLDYYEGDRPRHTLRAVHDEHKYLLQVRHAIRDRVKDVNREIETLKLREDELLLMGIDRRLKQRSRVNRW